MKTKIFIFTLLACIAFTSCTLFDEPANAHRIGSGHVQYDQGLYFVEIDSIKYATIKIYPNNADPVANNMIEPINSLEVTAFTLYKNNDVKFITGNIPEEDIEKLFTRNNTPIAIMFFIFMCMFTISIFEQKKSKKR